jgi:hypothetical protein
MRLKISFAFATGFERHTIPSEFAHIPHLEKPVSRQSLQELFSPQHGRGTRAGDVS